MTILSMYNEREYILEYENKDDSTWIFTAMKDVFDELNRIGETVVKVVINLPDDDPKPIQIKLWKRISRQAKANRFGIVANTSDLSKGILKRIE